MEFLFWPAAIGAMPAISGVLKAAAVMKAAGISLAAAAAAIGIFRALPARWLCDHGELPGPAHDPGNRCVRPARTGAALWAACFALELLAGGAGWVLAGAFAVLMAAVLSDREYLIIPDQCCGGMLVLGCVYGLRTDPYRLRGLVGGVLAVSLLMILSMLFSWVMSGRSGFGGGDLKLIAACGGCVGAVGGALWMDAAVMFFAGSMLSGACWFALQIARGRVHYGEGRPMAPFIAGSALVCMALSLRG